MPVFSSFLFSSKYFIACSVKMEMGPLKLILYETSLVVQWLRVSASNAGGTVLMLGWETES